MNSTMLLRVLNSFYFDYSLQKAFDNVNNEVPLNKLHVLGVTDGEQEWFKNYLPNRALTE